MSLRDHLIAAALAVAVTAVSLMTGRAPEVAAPPAGRPADLAEAHGGP
jgi:hypothetical protein